MSKAIAVGYLSQVSVSNVNASHTEGNVVVAKKVTLPDGSALPYISGQAIRRMLRDRLEGLGFALSEPFAQVSGQEVKPPVRPWDYVDEDLFGYLDPSGGRRRTSPVRVSAAIGVFAFQGDRDLGTRSFERFGEQPPSGGNMFETELYTNLFRGALLIELDRVGTFRPVETGEKHEKTLPPAERTKRLQALFEALGLLWGGGRTARMLVDLSPRFMAYARLDVKHPVFLEALTARYEDNKYWLELNPLITALDKFHKYTNTTIFGVDPVIFGNHDELVDALNRYGTVVKVHEAVAKIQEDVASLWNESSA